MKAKLVCYSLGKADAVKRTKFQREMYGYTDISCNGRYTYERKGLLGAIKHRKILDAIIVTNAQNSRLVVKLLRKYGAKTYVFDVIAPFKV
jgi:hypothetical protein